MKQTLIEVTKSFFIIVDDSEIKESDWCEDKKPNEEGEMLFDVDFPSLQPTKPNIYYDNPTIAEVVMWLYEKHGIWITVTSISQESWQCHMTKKGDSLGKCYLEDFYDPTEAYEAAIEYTLNNLI